MSESAFSSLGLLPPLLNNLSTLGYKEMTAIQAQSLPPILAGKDIVAQSQTGSGKTAAFGLGLLQKLDVKKFHVQSLVLCPTRELADQVAKEIRRLARTTHNVKILTLCGGMAFRPQADSLERGAHIIVGTPGRVEEHLRKEKLNLDALNMLVLDEADRMLDMGFQATLDDIIKCVPQERQTLLFSATYPDEIASISKRVMREPLRVQAAVTHDSSSIQQHFYQVDNNQQRLEALCFLLQSYRPDSTVVFCNTKKETDEVANELRQRGFSALALHGDLEQWDRDQTLVRFANKSASILVATDVAARGLDIDSLDAVINYHIARDSEVHIHRIGRTGRAGKQGIALSIYTEKESYKMTRLGEYLGYSIVPQALPDASDMEQSAFKAQMVTLQLDSGKKQKIRAGDILGALTGDGGVDGKQVGKIDIFDQCAYVAVEFDAARTALKKMNEGKLKGRSVRVRQLRGS